LKGAEVPEGFNFYLSNALAGDLKVLAYLFQSAFPAFDIQSNLKRMTFSSRGLKVCSTLPAMSRKLEVMTRSAGLTVDLSSIRSPNCESPPRQSAFPARMVVA